ncbi:MAG: protein-tyrosine phosphatase [Solirubrobacteraceae bacterium]|nr:protein-tyrosine phosphatase [Solirubrobacteraceae bacterium]
MIDLHCHILPGIDDGPQTLADSLAIARAAVAAGTRTIVATPHVSWEYPGVDADVVASGVATVQDALRAEGIPLELRTGAEIAMTRATDLSEEELARLRLGGGPWLLVECPLSPTPSLAFEAGCGRLVEQGHRLVLAHPERSPMMQRDPALLERLVGQGALCSVTAGALVGRFGSTVERFARDLVRRGLGHDVASDAHSTRRRPPSITPELHDAGFGAQALWLARDVPRAVLDGTEVPSAPAMPPAEKRGLAGLLARRA